jgi:alkanesulfonate monooxygenase SsuD/methylene tetrahydromethanopterin reductase-like flavin-dependent oxidoreductase (luciferase family)
MATWCLYGSPATVIEKLRAYQQLGIGNILCGTVTGPLTGKRLAYANQTLRLLAERVIPAFK